MGRKGSGEFERISWEEALAEVSTRWRAIIAESGAEAILPYSYMGTQGIVHGMSMDSRFFARVGATRLERTICGDDRQAGVAATLGTATGFDVAAW